MPIAKKGTRRIRVDGAVFRWTAGSDDEKTWLIVERDDIAGQRLVVTISDRGGWAVKHAIAPALVERCIRHGTASGWCPDQAGRPVTVVLTAAAAAP